jgi:hypothetical protein
MIHMMAFTRANGVFAVLYKAVMVQLLIAPVALQSCKNNKKVYQSDCSAGISFKHVDFNLLIDSIKNYDQQYVEVNGTYAEGKEESALVNDSLFVDHSTQHALWINFSQDCPLYLKGTRQGIFEYNDGQFTQLNNKNITIRGKVDVRHKGHLGSYCGSIDRISYVKL